MSARAPWIFVAARATTAFVLGCALLWNADSSPATIGLILAGLALADVALIVAEAWLVATDEVRLPLALTALADGSLVTVVLVSPPFAGDHLTTLWTAWAFGNGGASMFLGARTRLRAARWPAFVAGMTLVAAGAVASSVPLAGTAAFALLAALAAGVNATARAASAVQVARGGDDGLR